MNLNYEFVEIIGKEKLKVAPRLSRSYINKKHAIKPDFSGFFYVNIFGF